VSSEESSRTAEALARLDQITRRLRIECPWDREQDERSIVPHTVEESYELADAAQRRDDAKMVDELGDVLFQVHFLSLLLEERGAGDLTRVASDVTDKLIRRHPHVFGDEGSQTPRAVEGLWERIKAEEKAARGKPEPAGALAGVPVGLPALTRALKLQAKASKVGFDWNDPRAVLRKIREEVDEIEAELEGDEVHAATEVGDLLFAAVNLARHLDADPEAVLRLTNQKFERRFAGIERALAARGKKSQDATLAEMDALWDEAKAQE